MRLRSCPPPPPLWQLRARAASGHRGAAQTWWAASARIAAMADSSANLTKHKQGTYNRRHQTLSRVRLGTGTVSIKMFRDESICDIFTSINAFTRVSARKCPFSLSEYTRHAPLTTGSSYSDWCPAGSAAPGWGASAALRGLRTLAAGPVEI